MKGSDKASFTGLVADLPVGCGAISVGTSGENWIAGDARRLPLGGRHAGLLSRIFSFRLFMGVLLLSATFVVSRLNLPDPDTWWHARVGEQILATRSFPEVDSYSFSAEGTPWMAYEWLGDVMMGVASRAWGMQGLTLLLLGWAALFMSLLYLYAGQVSGNPKAAFIACALFLPVLKIFLTLRPQLLGYCFLLISLILLHQFRIGQRKTLWGLPIVFLLWVNTHGSFVIGLGILGLYWLSGLKSLEFGRLRAACWTPWQRRHLLLVGFLSAIAITVTPYGARLAAYPLQMALSQPLNLASINEWQPVSFVFWQDKLILGVLIFLLLALFFSKAGFVLEQFVLLLGTIEMALVHRRFVMILMIVLIPVVAKFVATWLQRERADPDRPLVNAFFLVLAVAGFVFFFPSRANLEQATDARYPVRAAAFLQTHNYAGHFLNEYGWGGYLVWNYGPQRKVFIDGRADIYEYSGVLADYLAIMRLDPEALSLLGKYDIRACLVEKDAPLAALLAERAEWKQAFADDLSIVFVRDSPGAQAAISEGVSRVAVDAEGLPPSAKGR